MRCVLVLIALTACPVVLGAADESPPILITRQLAEREHLQVGDVVHLVPAVGQTAARAFRIAGVYEPTPDPGRLGAVRHEAQLHLQDLLDLTRDPSTPVGSERVSTINVRLITPAEAPAFARDVAARTPGVSARPTAASADAAGPFVVLERFHLAIAIVTIIASTVFLLALTIMLVDERRATVGVLRLIGLPTHRILAQLFVEGSLVAVAGSAFGLLLALASQGLINRFFQWRYDTALVFVQITPRVAATCVAIAVPLGVGATVAASWALLRRNGLRLARR